VKNPSKPHKNKGILLGLSDDMRKRASKNDVMLLRTKYNPVIVKHVKDRIRKHGQKGDEGSWGIWGRMQAETKTQESQQYSQ